MSDKFSRTDQPIDGYKTGQGTAELDLGELVYTLIDNKALIAITTAVALFLGMAKAMLDTPIYKADAMLQIQEPAQPLGALDSMAGLFESKVPVEAEIEIIKSRRILGETVKNLKMEILVKPAYFPVIGKTVARRFQAGNENNEVSSPLFGFSYSQYAWGGEKIQIDTFDVPLSWIDRKFTLKTGKNGEYKLLDSNEQLILNGNVGKIATTELNKNGTRVRLYISQLKARTGTLFTVSKQSEASAITRLLASLSVFEKGKRTGILSFSLESSSAELAMERVNEIANIYVRLNVEQKSEEAQKTLVFLEEQLPKIKEQLDISTAQLNEYRLQKGSVDLSIETQSVLQGVVENRTQITLLQQKKDELRRRFTPSHPSVIAVDKQISRLRVLLDSSNQDIEELPETQQVILRLARDVEVNTELYTTLLNHLQTIKVAKAGTVGNVRIVDHAVKPFIPIKPKKLLIIVIATLLGVFVGIALAFFRKALKQGIEDPDLLEKHLDIPVYATVPHSPIQKKLLARQKKNKEYADSPAVLALEDNEDLAVESLRSLRTTLHFAFLEAKNNIIMITGPSPGIGKSFISTNLAVVLAESGKKVLLIDADMRKGLIHQMLGMERENGLSDLISNKITPIEAIRTIKGVDLDFLPTGAVPPNPSELLMHERFAKLLEYFNQQYDQVIIDSPPVLAVTDACIIGRMVSATLVVIKSGEHPLRELEQMVKRLKQNDVDIKGAVFNDVSRETSGYAYGKYIYQYNYKD